MGNIQNKKLILLKKELDKMVKHKERIFEKIDEEMYLISKSEKNKEKEATAQKNLGIYVIAELLESFEKEEQKQILEVLEKTFNETDEAKV